MKSTTESSRENPKESLARLGQVMIRDTCLVRCIGVARTYGSGANAVVAIHGVSCSIFPRMRVALTGPSGSGKSTLIHLMAGLDRPTAGTVQWPALDGDPLGHPGLIGVVFQGPSLLPPLNVLENVALPLVLAGHADSQARASAREALTLLELDDLANKLPEELSGGQAQRVAIARVLAGRPALILADEPTGQLDRATGEHVVDVLLAAAGELGAALVVNTHDRNVASRLDAEWKIRDGAMESLTEHGSPSDNHTSETTS